MKKLSAPQKSDFRRNYAQIFLDNIAETTEITGENAHHISRSLRMKPGEELILCDKRGTDFLCEITDFTSDSVFCKVKEQFPTKSEPSINLTLYQALPKLDKFELILQKAVELGIYRIVPVLTSRCISRPDEKSFRKKLERYEKIALEAAKQSGRGIIPEISGILSYKGALKEMSEQDLALMCYEHGGEKLGKLFLPSYKNISLLIGSEGGFSEDEVKQAKDNNVTPVWLGERILRCETAPLAAISIIMNLTDNM